MTTENLEQHGVVSFDVGGTLFSTTVETLDTFPNSLLSAMCRELHISIGEKPIYIDRCPDGFKWILSLYRLGISHFLL